MCAPWARVRLCFHCANGPAVPTLPPSLGGLSIAVTGKPTGLAPSPQALQRCSHCAQAGQSCRRPSARPHCCSREPRLLSCPGAIVSRPLLRTPLPAPTLSWPPASLTFLSLQNLSFLSPTSSYCQHIVFGPLQCELVSSTGLGGAGHFLSGNFFHKPSNDKVPFHHEGKLL